MHVSLHRKNKNWRETRRERKKFKVEAGGEHCGSLKAGRHAEGDV